MDRLDDGVVQAVRERHRHPFGTATAVLGQVPPQHGVQVRAGVGESGPVGEHGPPVDDQRRAGHAVDGEVRLDEPAAALTGLVEQARLDLAAHVPGEGAHQRVDVAGGAGQRERADHPPGVRLEDRGPGAGQALEVDVVVLGPADEHRPPLDEHGPDAVRPDRALGEVESLRRARPVHQGALAADVGVARDDPSARVGQHHRHGDVGEAPPQPVEHRLGGATQGRGRVVGLPVVDPCGCHRHVLARAAPPARLDDRRHPGAARRDRQQPAADERLPAAADELALPRRQGGEPALVLGHRRHPPSVTPGTVGGGVPERNTPPIVPRRHREVQITRTTTSPRRTHR